MLIQEKKFKDYLSQKYEPVDESEMPYLVDFRSIKAYADSKGVAIVSLSDEEKQQFMIPNPNYQKKRQDDQGDRSLIFFQETTASIVKP